MHKLSGDPHVLNYLHTGFICFSDGGLIAVIVLTVRKCPKLGCYLNQNINVKKCIFNDNFSFGSFYSLKLNKPV